MSDKTGIEWTDATWNPTTGCDQVSPGCDHCYAKTLAPRLKAMGSPRYQRDGDPKTSGPGFGVSMHPGALDQPLRWKRGRRIFVNSMSDLFHNEITDDFIAQVFAVMALAPQHTFQVLTKRHGRMRSLLNRTEFRQGPSGWLSFRDVVINVAFNQRNNLATSGKVPGSRMPNPDDLPWPLPNVWLGVSVEDQKHADLRVPALLNTPAAVRFLSCEPLLGAVDLALYLSRDVGVETRGIAVDWVIVGGESGRAARPMHPGWVDNLRDQCISYDVPFLFKQWGEFQDRSVGPDQRGTDYVVVWDGRHETTADHWAEDERGFHTSALARERILSRPGTAQATWISRVGKKAAGRELDGRTWDEFPGVSA